MPSIPTGSHALRRLGVVVALAATIVVSPMATAPVAAGVGDTVDGRHAGEGRVPAGGTIEFDVAGRGGVSADASVVALNLTITGPEQAGHATAYPCGRSRPTASTINYRAGQTIANAVLVQVGERGRVCIYTHAAAHIIADVNAELAGPSEFQAITPARLFDTREGFPTVDGGDEGVGRRTAGSTTELRVASRGGIGPDPTSVATNLTVSGATSAGFATIYPCGTPRPATSTLNYGAGETVANTVLVGVGERGRICIYTLAAAEIIVDVSGAFSGEVDFIPLPPARLTDSRPGHQTVDGRGAGGGIRGDGRTLELTVAGRGGSPSSAVAVSLNLAVTRPAQAGFATVYPCGEPRPEASTINFAAGQTVANGVVTKLGRGGKVCIFTRGATHVIADLDGYVPRGSSLRPLTPGRLLDTRSDTPPTAPPPPAPADDAASVSLRLLNELRARHGAGPVTMDAGMSATALAWSAEMSRTGFRHSSAGFAENIAWHSRSSMSPADAALRLHEMWVESPGHFRNMINPRWTRVGIGLHVDESGWYGTHMFTD